MPLDPQAKALLEQMAASGAPPLTAQSVAEARQALLAFAQLGGDPEPALRGVQRTIICRETKIPG